MNTGQHCSTSHRQFIHGYYTVLPCCSSRHCGFDAPSTAVRRVSRQPSFTIESILNSRSTSPPSRPANSVEYLRTQAAVSSLSAAGLSTLQRIHPYPCYSRGLTTSIEPKGEEYYTF